MHLENILQLFSLAIFFIVYKFFNIMAATCALMVATMVTMLLLYLKDKKKPSKMMIFSTIILLIFGTLSLIEGDAKFIKMKPTVIYLAFAGFLTIGAFFQKYFVRHIFEKILDLDKKQLIYLTTQWVIAFIGFAVLNELIWRSCDDSTWVNFKVFGIPVLSFVIIVSQLYVFRGSMKRV